MSEPGQPDLSAPPALAKRRRIAPTAVDFDCCPAVDLDDRLAVTVLINVAPFVLLRGKVRKGFR